MLISPPSGLRPNLLPKPTDPIKRQLILNPEILKNLMKVGASMNVHPSSPPTAHSVALVANAVKTNPSQNPPLAVFGFIAAAAIIVCLLIAVWKYAQRRQRRHEAEEHVRLHARVPDSFYGRELVRAFYTRLFDLPDNFHELNEPNFSVLRLGWLLGMAEQLGPSAVLNCSDLRPNAHPGVASHVSTREFWLDFELNGRRWAIWYPDQDYAVIERTQFGSDYVSHTHDRRTHAEIASWLRRARQR